MSTSPPKDLFNTTTIIFYFHVSSRRPYYFSQSINKLSRVASMIPIQIKVQRIKNYKVIRDDNFRRQFSNNFSDKRG